MKYLNALALTCAALLTGCQQTPLSSQKLASATPVLQNAQESALFMPPMQEQPKQHPKVALVLGSGGARGYAHIGVLEVLEQHGIQPDFIVGTSAGSIVGAIYASGKNAQQLKQIALNMKVGDVREITFDRKGFFDGQKVEDFVNEQVADTPLEKLKIPMYVVATELKNGKKTVFNYGNTGQAVRASISIPSMFVPTEINQKEYVDGGLVSPVPVDVARQLGADIVIAVDILAQPAYTPTTNIWGLFNQNINIMQNRLATEELKHADIVIQPELHEKAHIFDVKERESTIYSGEIAAQKKMGEIETAFAARQQKLQLQ